MLRTQVNARIHAVATLVVIVAGFGFGVARGDWLWLALAIGLVWMAEAFNTALEFLADEVSMEHRERIGQAKDVAAFAVLVAAVTAAVIGALVFWPFFARV